MTVADLIRDLQMIHSQDDEITTLAITVKSERSFTRHSYSARQAAKALKVQS
jgi:hypothetical protein